MGLELTPQEKTKNEREAKKKKSLDIFNKIMLQKILTFILIYFYSLNNNHIYSLMILVYIL